MYNEFCRLSETPVSALIDPRPSRLPGAREKR
jgi:hypothetical protein